MKSTSTKLWGLMLMAFFLIQITAQAQTVYYSEDFGGGLGDWTTSDSSSLSSGDLWVHTTVGPSGLFAIDPLASTTAGNGWAIFDSDLLCSHSQNAWLISPTIDLSGATTVILHFEQFFRSFQDTTSLEISSDDGQTWTSILLNETIADNGVTGNPEAVQMDISSYVAGSSTVRIAFRFLSDNPDNRADTGCAYAWQIDDIVLDNGMDPNVLWTEEFDGGMGGWENNNISVATDTAEWFWEPTGFVGNGILAPNTLRINSPTWDNGAMVYNSDLFTTGGDGGMAPSGSPPYPQYHSELISPEIDLSSNNFPISVQFHQLARVLNPAADAPRDESNAVLRTSVSWSTDGGATWSTPINANPNLAVNGNRGTVMTTIPIAGVTNPSQFKLKFIYALDFYYWVVDDIKIIRRTEHNMRANTNFYAIAPNAVTPKSQVEEFGFLCDIENIGGQTETGVTLNITIRDEGGNVVYTEDETYGAIGSDSLAENVLFGSYTPPMEEQVYDAEYTVFADSADANPTDNVIPWTFEVSDLVFAKERGATRNVAPADDNTFSYGNCYYVVNGDDYVASTITFGVANASEVPGAFVTTKLIKWNGDDNEDNEANPDEYEILAFNVYTFDGSEDDQLITIPFDFDSNKIPLEDNTYYIATVEYEDVSPSGDAELFYLASEEFDYSAMFFRTDSLDDTRYAGMLDVSLTGDLSSLGFGRDIVPLVRMNIEAVTGTHDELPAENIVKLYPNPAKDLMNLELDLVETSKEVEVSIADMSGRILRSTSIKDVKRDIFQLNVTSLQSGTYVLRILTDEGVRNTTFIKQ